MAKTINTRIQLKYDDLASWQSNNPTLLAGEIACVSIGEITTDNKGNRVIPPVMMKVGPGAFNDLGWTAAKAADVYAWAKKETPDWTDFPALPVEIVDDEKNGKFITGITYANNKITITRADAVNSIAAEDKSLNFDKATGDVKAKVNISSADNNTLELKTDGLYVPAPEKVALPEYSDEAVTLSFVTEVDQAEGKVAPSKAALVAGENITLNQEAAGKDITITGKDWSGEIRDAIENGAVQTVSLASGSANGTVALTVDGESAGDVAVTGLGSAAFTEASTYADAENTYNKTEVNQAITDAKAELIGESTDESSATTIHGAKKYADEKVANMVETYLTGDGAADTIDTLNEIADWVRNNDDAVGTINSLQTNKADKATKIEVGAGLTGGGDLSANRTIGLDKASAKTVLGFVEAGEVDTAITNALTGENATAVKKVANDAVTTEAIKNGAVTGDKIANKAINSDHFAADAVAPKATNAATADVANDLSEALDAEIADVAEAKATAAVEALNFTDTAVAGQYVSAVHETKGIISVDRTPLPTYHEIATTGSIYDVAEGANVSVGTDVGVEYLIFNCGSATTII